MILKPEEPSRYGKWLNLPLDKVLEYYDKIDQIPNEAVRRHNQRVLALHDVFYLLVRICGRKDMIHPWLYDRAREVQKSPDGHLDLWARDHYKSTIITFGMTIQDVLANPEETVLILSHTMKIAQMFLRQIMTEFENNTALVSLFPNVLWQTRERPKEVKWSEQDGITLKRRTNPKEPTIRASGLVDGMPTATHFGLLVYDDTVVPASVSTPEMIQKTTSMFNLSDNLGSQGKTRKRVIGTRYHLFDTYQDTIERGLFVVRKHPATSDGSDDCSKSVLLPPEVLAKKKLTQAQNFYAQMLLEPRADSISGFKREHLQFWPAIHHRNLNKIILVDPSSGKHREKNKGDYTAMWCLGKGQDAKKYAIDMVRDRLTLYERIDILFQMVEDYRPLWVFYEETGSDSDIQAIKKEQERRNFRFNLFPLPVRGVKKKERILRLQPTFAAGDIFLPHRIIQVDHEGKSVDMLKEFIEQEYIPYPSVAHDDAIDCLSQMEDEEVIKRWPVPVSGITPAPGSALSRYKSAHRKISRERSWMAG